VSRARAWYLVLLVVVGLGAAAYGAISHLTFWLFVGLAWLFLAFTQLIISRRR
jgi:hypothetical protein